MKTKKTCYVCASRSLRPQFVYQSPPEGETRFTFSTDGDYRRRVVRCDRCGHFMSFHEMDDRRLYGDDYVNSTYGGNGLAHTFQRIINLDPFESDNVQRCARVDRFGREWFGSDRWPARTPCILDVGSGLGVFLHRMTSLGWQGVALDPDPRAAEHARRVVGVEAIESDFFEADRVGRFEVVSFNKVLEHVEDPIGMLARSLKFLEPGGFVYVELPDGEVACRAGSGREEFFIEHHHVFSMSSLALAVTRAGFELVLLERLHEPSTKFTLRAFLRARDSAGGAAAA